MERDLREMLEGCIAQLPEYMREPVRLRFLAGVSLDEISAPTGEKAGDRAGAVQARVARAMSMIRRCMESKGWKP